MPRHLLPALAALIVAGCTAQAQTPAPPPAQQAAAAPGISMTPAQIVAARKASLRLSAGVMGALKGVVERGEDPKPSAFAASGIAKWAHSLPDLFPAGTAIDGSRALPAIWTNRAAFDAIAARYATDADAMEAAARANDKTGFAAKFAAVEADCSACHKDFRAK